MRIVTDNATIADAATIAATFLGLGFVIWAIGSWFR